MNTESWPFLDKSIKTELVGFVNRLARGRAVQYSEAFSQAEPIVSHHAQKTQISILNKTRLLLERLPIDVKHTLKGGKIRQEGKERKPDQELSGKECDG